MKDECLFWKKILIYEIYKLIAKVVYDATFSLHLKVMCLYSDVSDSECGSDNKFDL